MTQKQLAERLHTSESTISNLEREQHPPTVPDQVNDLVLALALAPEELLSAMGVRMTPPAAAGLPLLLVEALCQLPRDDQIGLIPFVQKAALGARREEATAQP